MNRIDEHVLRFSVRGVPVPQGRARFARMGNFVRAYDPARSKDWKSWVRIAVLEQMREIGREREPPHAGPVDMTISYHFERPLSYPKWRIEHTTKPDLTNLTKGIEDALEGIVYKNDSQIVSEIIRKGYAEPPGVEIVVIRWRER